jgi:predicted permease
VEALRGRIFTDEDDPREGAHSLMLTERFWRERFAADPDVLGSTVRLDGEPYTIVGILPSSVDFMTRRDADAWTVVTGSSTDESWGNHSISRVVGRLRDGVSVEQAQEEVARLMAEVPEDANHGHGASVFPAAQDSTRRVRAPLLVLIGGAFLLLAVGCGNVAALLLGAGIDREREIAVRGALGAGRGRLSRQLLTESLLLAGVGALGGVALAAALHSVLLHLAPPDVPRIAEAALDGRVLAFAVGVSLLGGVLFGMVPALGLSRPDLAASINAARGTTSGGGRLQAAVVVGELALATVLLVGAALLGRTLWALNEVEIGLDTGGLYAVRLAVPYERFDGDDVEAAEAAADGYFREITDAVRAVPGVEGLAVTNNVPLTGDRNNNDVQPEGWDAEAEGEVLIAERRFVSDGYFDVTGIALVEGRGFESTDNRSDAAPVMVVSQGLARRVWPDESAVGKQVSFWGRDPSTVVGVAADLRDESLERETRYAFYVPMRQVGAQIGNLLIRVGGDPESVLPAVRERVWSVDPGIPVTSMTSFEALQADAVSEQRYRARLMVTFAVLAGLFALMGVYGVVARSVARRTREMGIRAALGAKRTDIHGLVLIQGFRLALFGAVLGVAVSWWATRFLEGMLFGVEAMDVATLVAIAALVGAASLAASLPPSRRATRVDPTEALRAE